MLNNEIRERMFKLSELKSSRIILALDKAESLNLLNNLLRYFVCVKIGLPLLISVGANTMKSIIAKYKNDVVFIADLKIADIPETNESTTKIVKEIGFDAVIAHTFVGSESLKSVTKILPVFALVGMSHKDAHLINSNTEILINISISSGIFNFVAPATYPEIIKKLRSKIPNALIISPGVGAQGAHFGSALKAGADFEIIGRSITLSQNPLENVQKILKAHEYVLKEKTLS
ncbi:MAG: orotidine-5'-phosphate decarboxylase [Thermoprotei archaeon]